MSDAVAVVRAGRGPEVLLVHGGASPRVTWRGLESLAARWTLATVHRRGYPPSPPPLEGRQDFAADAADLAPLLASRPHVVAHSYGCLGTLLAASQTPERVRSLTVIEPPLAHLVSGDAEAEELACMGDEVLTHGLATDPATLRAFLRIAGAPVSADGALGADVINGVRRAHGGRLTSEARPRLAVLREARVPALVASGAHHRALEAVCDVVAAELGARRVVCPGAGHFVPAAPGFAGRLEEHLLAADGAAAGTEVTAGGGAGSGPE